MNNLHLQLNYHSHIIHKYYLINICNEIAKLEILYNISKNPKFKRVQLYDSNTPYFKGVGLYDINLSKPEVSDFEIHERSATSSSTLLSLPLAEIEQSNHFLLTGPNGGGKSSFLRAVLQTILFSQTFGYAVGTTIEMSPFDYILSGLHIEDIPGKKSLFEKEICFAREVLYCNNPDFKGLVLFDEIFHSTNPPDGIKTANRFLNKLW